MKRRATSSKRFPLQVAGWFLLLGTFILLCSREHPARASHDATHPFPHATVRVWDTAAPILPSLSLGMTPGESVEDPSGLTGHGTSFPTVVTVYANGSHPLGPSGLSYWNPDGNLFAWYGKTIGYPPGVDINRAGPAQPTTHAACGPVSFGPGDVWVTGQGEFSETLYVHIAGTDCFRTYGTDQLVGPIDVPRDQTWGVELDDRTGQVFFASPQGGRIVRIDPPTGDFVIWVPGGSPAYVAVDSAGRPYTTLSDSDAILRVDPGLDGVLGNADDTATFWRVPSVNGISSFQRVPSTILLEEENPNSIILADAEDNIWFAETNSNEIGRLSRGPDGILGTMDDEICEFTKDGLLGPQQIAATGSGASLQVYFTEFEGDSVSVLTAVEADQAESPTRICTTVPAETLAGVFSQAGTTVLFDEEVLPLRTAIVPTVHDVPGLDGSASGMTTTAEGEPIPPILRFSPMPNPILSADGTPIGDAGNGFPSGMTGVYATNRIAGAYLKGNKHFEVRSGAIIAPAPPPGPGQDGLPGRMTGGGRLFTADGRRVTHGFVLRCPGTVPEDDGDGGDALQVNWEKGNRFHLTRVTSRSCTDDPAIDPGPPDGGESPMFDTHSGSGDGRYNGFDGATVEWTFTDAGEPGKGRDRARIVVRDAAGAVVLEVDGTLDGGNHQAHAAEE